ncbi:transglycosylase [Dimargaris cristalligena]|nr:transglycosylase [Dimargaris cristalligena]
MVSFVIIRFGALLGVASLLVSTFPLVSPQPIVNIPSGPNGVSLQKCWTKDWTFENDDYLQDFDTDCANNIKIADGIMSWEVTEDCFSPSLIYKHDDILYGQASIDIKMARGSGIVTAFIRGMGGKDEIDVEWVGKDLDHVQFMYYVNGSVVNSKFGTTHFEPPAPHKPLNEEFFTYTIDYAPNRTQWYVGDNLGATLERTATNKYPSQAREWRMNLWNGGAIVPAWAGKTDWSKGPFVAFVRRLSFTTTSDSALVKAELNQDPPQSNVITSGGHDQ